MQIDVSNALMCNSTTSNTGTQPIIQSSHPNSEVNSDLDGSDFDVDSDSQIKQDKCNNKSLPKNEQTCDQMKNLFFERVPSDISETDNSIDFKAQPNDAPDSEFYNDSSSETKRLSTEFDSGEQPLIPDTTEMEVIPSLISSINDVEIRKPNDHNDCNELSITNSIENANASKLDINHSTENWKQSESCSGLLPWT